jgi:hypothetical protein
VTLLLFLPIWYHYAALGPQSMSQAKKFSLDLEFFCYEQFVTSLCHILFSHLPARLAKFLRTHSLLAAP